MVLHKSWAIGFHGHLQYKSTPRSKSPASDLDLPLILRKTPHKSFPPGFISSLNSTLELWIYEFMNINTTDMPFIIFLTLSNGSAKYCSQMHERYTSCLIHDKLWVTGFYCSSRTICSFTNTVIIINHHGHSDRGWGQPMCIHLFIHSSNQQLLSVYHKQATNYPVG